MPARGLGLFKPVVAISPVNLQTGANAGDWICMKDWGFCTTIILIGTNGSSGTCAVTFDKAETVSGGTTTLAFDTYYVRGYKIPYTGASGAFTAGETVTGGTSSATIVVYADYGSYIIGYTWSGTDFTSTGETLTGGTSGTTATSTSVQVNEDMLVPVTASSNTFTTQAKADKIYAIEHEAAELGDGYDYMQLDMAQASQASTYGCALYILSEGRYLGRPDLGTAIY